MFSSMLAHGHFTPLGSGHFRDATVPRSDAQSPSDPTDYYTFEDLEAEAASTAASPSEADVCENADVATCPPCQDLEAVIWKPSLFCPPRDQGLLAAERRPEGGSETAQTATTPTHSLTHAHAQAHSHNHAHSHTQSHATSGIWSGVGHSDPAPWVRAVLDADRPELDRLLGHCLVRQPNMREGQPKQSKKTRQGGYATSQGVRQHKRDLQRARANRKARQKEQSSPTQRVLLTSPAVCHAPLIPRTLSTAAPPSREACVSRTMALAPPVGLDSGNSSTLEAPVTSPQPTDTPAPGKLDLPASTAEDATLTGMDESDRASAASTVDLAASLVAFMYGLYTGVPHGHRNRARRFKMTVLQPRQLLTSELPPGRLTHYSNARALRCARSLMRNLGRSRWLNGPCRCLHHGCTNGTGPRPAIEP